MLINETAIERLGRLPYLNNHTTVLHFTNVVMMVALKATTGDADWRVATTVKAAGLTAIHQSYATLMQFAQSEDRPWRTPDEMTAGIRAQIGSSAGLGDNQITNHQITRLCEITNSAFYLKYAGDRTNNVSENSLCNHAFDMIASPGTKTVGKFYELYPGHVGGRITS